MFNPQKYKLMNSIDYLIKDMHNPHSTLVKNVKIKPEDLFVAGHHKCHVDIFTLWSFFSPT